MRRKIFITIVLIRLITVGASAQDKKEEHLSFQSFFQEGIVTGESGTVLQLQFINGIRYKTFFAGAGAGLDYYYERSIPVFLDLRKKIFNKSSAPFLYADGGYAFLWQKEKDVYQMDSHGGLFYELGAGYEIQVYKKLKLLLCAGYSYKSLSKTINKMPWLSVWPPSQNALDKYDYSLRRISLKAGFRF
ncbi:MAG TPA: hypothetical protein VKC90_12350 [Chitinophagaceae bacterium]|nr:hypothetical protein [Chitinophagaceae bacterium]